MSHHLIPCPNCHNEVLVRFEHVITGANVSRNYYCGACDNTWFVHDSGPAATKTDMNRRPNRLKLKRRGK